MLAALCPLVGRLTLWQWQVLALPGLGPCGDGEWRLKEAAESSGYVPFPGRLLYQLTPTALIVLPQGSSCPLGTLLYPSLAWNTVSSCCASESTVNTLFLQWQLIPLGCFSGDTKSPTGCFPWVLAHVWGSWRHTLLLKRPLWLPRGHSYTSFPN